MNNKVKISALILFFFHIASAKLFALREIETIFGKLQINDPVIEKLIDSPPMERLKHIDQSGTLFYWGYMPRYTRYKHSLGVYALLNKYERSVEEQVAGLLHDVSHTVFSHVGDSLFKDFSQQVSYQDDIHGWYLKETKLDNILKEYNLKTESIDPKNKNYTALDQELPSLCADRIEYILHTGLILGKLTENDIKVMVKDLKFKNNKWFFTSIDSAKKIALLSLYLTEQIYGAPWNYVLYEWSADLLKRALNLKLITLEEIHFGRDQEVLRKIENSSDNIIKKILYKCKNPSHYYKTANDNYDVIVKPKFRGVDPLVYNQGRLIPLTRLDQGFRKKYNHLYIKLKKGIKIKFIN